MDNRNIYPFTAIVGQEKMKQALLLNLIDPKIGGLLIRGEKGTAKSTVVRSLAAVAGGMQVVELPLGVTEDKLVGSLDIEHAIKTGQKKFEPGILSKAHNNILYVDEVNLLDDSIVDLLLDVAAMGVNTVERDGVSHSHDSKFVLIGTMNPEEGELRPQLLDRFGLSVEVRGSLEPSIRVEVMKRRLEFERSPETMVSSYADEQHKLLQKICSAREMLELIDFPESLYQYVARIACSVGVDGHRADIVMVRAARGYGRSMRMQQGNRAARRRSRRICAGA
jgi:magnesium chelatase subunit I